MKERIPHQSMESLLSIVLKKLSQEIFFTPCFVYKDDCVKYKIYIIIYESFSH